MSSPAGKAKASDTSKPKDGETPTQAVRIMESSQAQVVRHLHPVLLASLFLARFSTLVADPVSTMSSAIPVVVVVQVTYAITCLPAAGSQIAKPAKKLRPGEKKKPGSEGTGPNIAVVCIPSSCFFCSRLTMFSDDPCCSDIISYFSTGIACCSCSLRGPFLDARDSDVLLLDASSSSRTVPVVLHAWCVE